MNNKSKSPAFPCAHCDKGFDTQRALTVHTGRAHAATDAPSADAGEVEKLRAELETARAAQRDAEARAERDYAAAERAEAEVKNLTGLLSEALVESAAKGRAEAVAERDRAFAEAQPLRDRIKALETERDAARRCHNEARDYNKELSEQTAIVCAQRDAAEARVKALESGDSASAPSGDSALRLAIVTAERDEARAALARIGDAWATMTAGVTVLSTRKAPRSPVRAPGAPTTDAAPGALETGSNEAPSKPANETGAAPAKRLQRCIACGQCVNPRRRERCPQCIAANRPEATPEQWADWTEQARRKSA